MLPKGFKAQGLHCGVAKKKEKKDLAVFCSDVPAACAGMFTKNLAKAAPVIVSAGRLEKNGAVRAIVANSGNANACTGARGLRDAEDMCAAAAKALGIVPGEVLVASTGVIGRFLPVEKIRKGIGDLSALLKDGSDEDAAVRAIMTTDTFPKTAARKIRIGGKTVTVWGCAKGAGMIHPDLTALHATMFAFILTDAAVRASVLKRCLPEAVEKSFNCVSVDGDTSTNDTVFLLANGASGAAVRDAKDSNVFSDALEGVCLDLAKMMARDGEGATRLVEIEVKGARTAAAAKKIAATIATSPLVKTAVFGRDANWGRILAAAGRAGVPFKPEAVDIFIGTIPVARRGMAVRFSEAAAKKYLSRDAVKLTLDLNQGRAGSTYYTCDLTFDYIKINASYRS